MGRKNSSNPLECYRCGSRFTGVVRKKLLKSHLKKCIKDVAAPFRLAVRRGSLTHPGHPLSCTCGCQEGPPEGLR